MAAHGGAGHWTKSGGGGGGGRATQLRASQLAGLRRDLALNEERLPGLVARWKSNPFASTAMRREVIALYHQRISDLRAEIAELERG